MDINLQEWDPESGPIGSQFKMTSSAKGHLYIEGIGTTLYGLTSSTRELVTITYNGQSASITILGTITSTDTITSFLGLTSVGSTLYSFGLVGSTWALYAIDTTARTAGRVNLSSSGG